MLAINVVGSETWLLSVISVASFGPVKQLMMLGHDVVETISHGINEVVICGFNNPIGHGLNNCLGLVECIENGTRPWTTGRE